MPHCGINLSTQWGGNGRRAFVTSQPLPPETCQTMTEVRAGVDAIDMQILALIETRFAYMRAAARIKEQRATVRDEARKAQVIDNVRRQARAANLPAEELAELWNRLVEASIAYEFEEWDRTR